MPMNKRIVCFWQKMLPRLQYLSTYDLQPSFTHSTASSKFSLSYYLIMKIVFEFGCLVKPIHLLYNCTLHISFIKLPRFSHKKHELSMSRVVSPFGLYKDLSASKPRYFLHLYLYFCIFCIWNVKSITWACLVQSHLSGLQGFICQQLLWKPTPP